MGNNIAGKLAGDRIIALLDHDSFVEIGGAITARNTDFNLQDTDTPGDGVITGYGLVAGNLVYVYSQDNSVLGGAIGEMHAKKIMNIYDMAMKMGAPVIGFVDCAGLRLQEGTDALEAFGGIYYKQAMASGLIPQITAIFGSCGGGLSIVPGLTDFVFMEKNKGKLFVNSPNALADSSAAKLDTASAEYQSSVAGMIDMTGSEEEILERIRTLITMIPANNADEVAFSECMDDPNRLCPELEDVYEDSSVVLASISDNNQLLEMREEYAREMVVGLIRLNGMTVGAVANRTKVYDVDGTVLEEFDGALTVDGCKKAVEFVKFCNAFNIPILTVTNMNGYSATPEAEKDMGRSAARLAYTFVNSSVPKVNVIIGKAFGTAYIVMNSKALGADMVYAWPTAEIGMMDAGMAAKIMYDGKDIDTIRTKEREYAELQNNPLSAARRGYVDTIIEPQDTRKYVIGAFEMLYTKREDRPNKKHGTV